jgi:ankyrin repeat protein
MFNFYSFKRLMRSIFQPVLSLLAKIGTKIFVWIFGTQNIKDDLPFAVLENDLPTIRKLAKQANVNVNWQAENGWTVLMSATFVGNVEAMKELAKFSSIDANLQNNQGSTALVIATC